MAETDLKSRTTATLTEILDALRKDTDAGRTTVRLDDCGLGFEVASGLFDDLTDLVGEPVRAAFRSASTLAEVIEVVILLETVLPLVDPRERPFELSRHVGGRDPTAEQVNSGLSLFVAGGSIHVDLGVDDG